MVITEDGRGAANGSATQRLRPFLPPVCTTSVCVCLCVWVCISLAKMAVHYEWNARTKAAIFKRPFRQFETMSVTWIWFQIKAGFFLYSMRHWHWISDW